MAGEIMDNEAYFVTARVVHVIGVVLWIGGVAFITTVLLPALRKMPDAEKSMALFGAVEGRFKLQAKIVTLITGLSGFFMLDWLHAWGRYMDPSFWWVHMMTFIWLVFTLALFVIEPLLMKRGVQNKARRDPARALGMVHRMLWILLSLSLVTILGAVAGVRGFLRLD